MLDSFYIQATTEIYSLIRSRFQLWLWFFRQYHHQLDRLGKWKALMICRYAARKVPAYQQFLKQQGIAGIPRSFDSFPVTTKDGYVKAFSIEERCVDGSFWEAETQIDESSGSSGKPQNWVRSGAELSDIHYSAANYAKLMFGQDKYLVINAFSMGAWATGINTGRGLSKLGVIKSTGPDLEKILDTITIFGPNYHYLVTGYPPFLKHVFDTAMARNIDLSGYSFSAMVGGEGLTEGLRDYLEKFAQKVRSVYGLSDVQIGMAAETDICVALRKLLLKDRLLAAALLGPDEDRVPMVFQYNPLEFYLETNEHHELIATATSTAIISPKVRYNTSDEARLFGYKELDVQVKKSGGSLESILKDIDTPQSHLPFLFLFGRKNGTVSYMGANIYPQDIENGLYHSKYASQIFSFFMRLSENDKLESRPEICLVLQPDSKLTSVEKKEMVAIIQAELVAYLMQVSRDYASAVSEDPTAKELVIKLIPFDDAQAQATRKGIKQQYVVKGHS
jgi:phenylacetate-CoA ligase